MNELIYVIKIVFSFSFRIEPLNSIIGICSEESKNKFLLAYSDLLENKAISEKSEELKKFIDSYGTEKESPLNLLKYNFAIQTSDIEMKNYNSIYEKESDYGL